MLLLSLWIAQVQAADTVFVTDTYLKWSKKDAKGYVQLSTSAGRIIGITSDGSIYCGAMGDDPFSNKQYHWKMRPVIGPGTLKDGFGATSISIDALMACITTFSGSLYCTKMIGRTRPTWVLMSTPTSAPTFNSVSIGGGLMCGIASESLEVFCSRFMRGDLWTSMGGNLSKMSVNNDGARLCGINADRNIFCAQISMVDDTITNVSGYVQINGQLDSISFHGDTLCGIQYNVNSMYCVTESLVTANSLYEWTQFNFNFYTFSSLSISDTYSYGIDKDGYIYKTDSRSITGILTNYNTMKAALIAAQEALAAQGEDQGEVQVEGGGESVSLVCAFSLIGCLFE
eukprot:NODE_284_length_11815_cov_0.176340.p1 type:complete len:343 gc:universal NODE_284_length_11815_cov_0.176340:5200-6228(+)